MLQNAEPAVCRQGDEFLRSAATAPFHTSALKFAAPASPPRHVDHEVPLTAVTVQGERSYVEQAGHLGPADSSRNHTQSEAANSLEWNFENSGGRVAKFGRVLAPSIVLGEMTGARIPSGVPRRQASTTSGRPLGQPPDHHLQIKLLMPPQRTGVGSRRRRGRIEPQNMTRIST